MPLGQHAAFAAVGQRLRHSVQQRLLVVQIVIAAAGHADGTAGQHLRHKAGESSVHDAGLHRLLQLMDIALCDIGLREKVHAAEHRQQHHKRHQHGHAGDLPAEPADHDCPSSSRVRQ